MADLHGEVTCAAGCGETGPAETMAEMPGGDYQCAECLGAAMLREPMDDRALPEGSRLTGEPQEVLHRRAG